MGVRILDPPGWRGGWFIDMSAWPLETVAAHSERIRFERGYRLEHPDLWHDGIWEPLHEPPPRFLI